MMGSTDEWNFIGLVAEILWMSWIDLSELTETPEESLWTVAL